ncbi:hypothetical protein [Vallitalea guaymasensis]|uniref:Uncharacterized protein n=1 Tax=Vallitalea guaymasensis TaxID=1185412 RepID=A0A8J8M6X7_9FIRM|nr:hypothetical protein [Vallitalea guaymasensis]QUH27456.1 hypothetical protein HYG85_00375 [Vallitalea guaymasensis]
MKICMVFVLCGLIYGVFVAILFCQISNKKRSIASFGIGCIVSAFLAIYEVFTEELAINKADVFIWFVLFFIIGFILCFGIYIYCLNIQEDRKYKVKPIDILMNNYNILEAQYKDMESEIESRNKLKIKELLEKETEIQSAKQELSTLERKIRDQINRGIYINIDKQIPITQYFIDRLPEYVENVANYTIELYEKTNMFIKNYYNHKNNKDQFVQGFIYAVAVITCKVLFDTNKDVNVCIKYFTKEYNNKVSTDVSKTDNIFRVTGDKAVFAKGDENISANSGNFEDIMVIEFNKVHIIKMEIMIRNNSKYKEFTCFLKYCKIDQIIQFFLLEFIDACDIINIREANNG